MSEEALTVSQLLRMLLVIATGSLVWFSAAAADAPASKPSAAAAAAALEKQLGALKFDNIALADALDMLREASGGATFTADWDELRKLRIDVTTPVTADIPAGKRLREVLDIVLKKIDDKERLAYRVEDESIEITTKEVAKKK
jgi:hypothetical protein